MGAWVSGECYTCHMHIKRRPTTDPIGSPIRSVPAGAHLPSAHDNTNTTHPHGQELSYIEDIANKGSMRELMDPPTGAWHVSDAQFELHGRET